MKGNQPLGALGAAKERRRVARGVVRPEVAESEVAQVGVA